MCYDQHRRSKPYDLPYSLKERDDLLCIVYIPSYCGGCRVDDYKTDVVFCYNSQDVFEFIHEVNRLEPNARAAALARSALDHFNSVLDVLEEEEPLVDAEIERLVAERQKAREAKDYARADAIRDELARRGIILEDTPQGVRIRRKAGPPRA